MVKENQSVGRTTRRKIGIGCGLAGGLLLVVVLLFLYLRQRPIYSDAELAEQSAVIEEARASALEAECERAPVFGTPLESDSELIDLLDVDGEFAECRTAARDAMDALAGSPSGVSRRWNWDVPPTEVPEASTLGLAFIQPGVPYYPPEETPGEFRRVAEACAQLPQRIDELARDGSSCTPLGPHHRDWLDETRPGAQSEIIPLVRALSVLARLTARDGDPASGLKLLIQGIAVIRNLRQGPVNMIYAMIGVAAEGILWSSVQNLLNQTESLEPDFRAQLERELDHLGSIETSPHELFRAELIATYDYAAASIFDDDVMRLSKAVAHRGLQDLDDWCPPEATVHECHEAVPSFEVWDEEELEQLSEVIGRRTLRGPILKQALNILYQTHPRYLLRLTESELMRQQIRVFLELLDHRNEGRCPGQVNLSPELLQVEGTADPIEISRLSGSQFEITAPALAYGASRPVLLFLCPMAPGGVWRDGSVAD